ncbi:hypothetical protein SAMN05660284_01530 [Formivibrio citricus]|uniref:Uncharacterized protein n=1 Tax=Formivibrio citricus TaxID=83765 RepID=A0A1I4Z5B0_9NEIS|nr:hypothetical protein [Formivibrio citricus]SFN45347.1 hypothetical protein SAMN05660284_01530 [Formivibrio citricus]
MNQNGPIDYLVSFAICFALGALSVQLLQRRSSAPAPNQPKGLESGGIHDAGTATP